VLARQTAATTIARAGQTAAARQKVQLRQFARASKNARAKGTRRGEVSRISSRCSRQIKIAARVTSLCQQSRAGRRSVTFHSIIGFKEAGSDQWRGGVKNTKYPLYRPNGTIRGIGSVTIGELIVARLYTETTVTGIRHGVTICGRSICLRTAPLCGSPR